MAAGGFGQFLEQPGLEQPGEEQQRENGEDGNEEP